MAPGNAGDSSNGKVIMLTLLSTTCRTFIPTLGLFGIGAVVDFNFDTKPWAMLIGVSLGMVIAGVLVFLQFRSIKKDKDK